MAYITTFKVRVTMYQNCNAEIRSTIEIIKHLDDLVLVVSSQYIYTLV